MVSSIQLKGVDNLATNKNITMKQFNGTDYDTLYPKTIGAQIEGAVPIVSGGTNGTTAPSGVNNLVAGLSQIAPASNDLFPFRDISDNTGGSVTLANLAVALGNNGVIISSNLAAQVSALGFVKNQVGSYVGTGTSGENNPCSLTFDFAPKLVIIRKTDGSETGIFVYNSEVYLMLGGPHASQNGPCSQSNNTISWYYADSQGPRIQLNYLNATYVWVAIG